MKSSKQVADHLAWMIANIYARPRMYGGTAAGVDLLLHAYHQMWAFVVEREPEFEVIWRGELEKAECGSATFASRYSMNHPTATEDEVTAYDVVHWKNVSVALGILSSDR